MIDFALIRSALPFLLHGALVTLQLAFLGGFIGITFGTLLGIIHASSWRLGKMLVSIYVTLIRGTPMLIQIICAVYILPQFGISLSPFWATILAVGCNSTAYVSQVVKSGISSVSKGQIEAAHVLGFSKWQTMRYIILPQALSTVAPSLGNELVTLVKETSLASVVGVAELTYQGNVIKSRTFDAISVYAAVALLYLIITGTLTLAVHYFDRRMKRHVTH